MYARPLDLPDEVRLDPDPAEVEAAAKFACELRMIALAAWRIADKVEAEAGARGPAG